MPESIISASRRLAGICLLVTSCVVRAWAQPSQARYFAHPAVEDRYGVIAPWYQGLNGQCDFRVRITAETLKRYPWATKPKTGLPAPDYIYNGWWEIKPDGTILPRKLEGLGQWRPDPAFRLRHARVGQLLPLHRGPRRHCPHQHDERRAVASCPDRAGTPLAALSHQRSDARRAVRRGQPARHDPARYGGPLRGRRWSRLTN